MIASLRIKRLTQRQKFIAGHLHLPMKQTRKTVKIPHFGGDFHNKNWTKIIKSSGKEATYLATKINSRARCYIFAENLRSCPSRTNILRAKNISCKYESAKTNRNSNAYDKCNTKVSNSIDGKPCRPMTSTHFAGQSRGSTQLKTALNAS